MKRGVGGFGVDGGLFWQCGAFGKRGGRKVGLRRPVGIVGREEVVPWFACLMFF